MVSKQTTLDLNGPILSFTTQPQSIGVCDSGSTTFVGIATAFFPTQDPPNPASNTGTLSYRWYAKGFGPLTDGTFQGASITGSGTTTLTITNVTSPTSNGLKFYVGVDYIPSAYSQPVGSAVTLGTGRSTGNAVNEILNSNSATLTVFPVLSVAQQPTEQTAAQTRSAIFTTLGALTDTTQGNILYRWQLNGNDLSDSTTVIGSGSTSLSIALPSIGINTVTARLTHPTACNSPIFTNTVNFNVVDARQILNIEIENNYTSPAIEFRSTNLSAGALNFTGFPGANAGPIGIYFYAVERDIKVKVTLAGSAGKNKGSFIGGQGGLSSFELLMKKNVEYHVKIGATDVMFANGGGGGAVYMHEQSRIIAICGGGGGAGSLGNGGDGGGINVVGGNGKGSGAGIGGYLILPGTLPSRGFLSGGSLDPYSTTSSWETKPTGGRASGCPYGSNWVNAGFSPCQNYFGQARDISAKVSGTFYTRTAFIDRGFKPGEWAYRTNGGNGFNTSGGGGNGTIGGNASQSGSGGGGGSGYSDGSIRVLSTQLGGNTSERGYIVIESLL